MKNNIQTISDCRDARHCISTGFDNLTAEQIGKLFPIRIVPYNPDWKMLFEQEKALLTAVLGVDTALSIEHIGSTAVEGLASKPTIDILIDVPILSSETKRVITEKLKTASYGNMYNTEKENEMTFGKGYGENGICTQTFHVHIRIKSNTPQNEIYFRDYLRENSAVRNEYAKLKYTLSEKYQFNREKYTQAKTEFVIKHTEQKKMSSNQMVKPN